MTVGEGILELNPSQLGSLELDGQWLPYVDLYDEPFLPTRIKLGPEEYGYSSSIIILGHGAVLPARIRELRAAGKKPLIIQREDRYYVFVTPP